jgi:predicted  nucleic acid-binding Zn-ribbon protein
LETLLRLQDLDLKIGQCSAREVEIPKQKNKFDIRRTRLQAELEERDKIRQDLIVEQGGCETEIEQKQAQIEKYQQQLNIVKKNDEYQALIHEIDLLKKQIGLHEERIINIMVELDDAKARLEADKKRIDEEMKDIDRQCEVIDEELKEAVVHREELELQRGPIEARVDTKLIGMYRRIRSSNTVGRAVVPLIGEVCGGCHMHERAQIVNEVMAGVKIHTCQHCGRLLFHPDNVGNGNAGDDTSV